MCPPLYLSMNIYRNKFNNQDIHLVISDYPETTNKEERNHGIAWYTKQLIEPLAKNYNLKFVVLAEKGKDNRPKTYQNNKILVLRVFDKKHFFLFPRILKLLISFNRVKRVDVHSEFCANGSITNLILLLPFLFLIKINRRHITYFAHNVVKELDSIAPHLGFKKKSVILNIFNFGLKFYYNILATLVDRFVVMDNVIYKRLSELVGPKKIILSPFWIQSKRRLSKGLARQKLNLSKNEFVLLYFGFITYYKGADWIIKAVKKLRSKNKFKNISLILAGGKAYSLKDKSYYQIFYQNLLDLIKNDKHIRITGFVSEKDISSYFKAADVVVFPYRGIIGASGSLSHAISYHKPFIIGSKMHEMIENQEIRQILTNNNLDSKNIMFSYNYKSLEESLNKIQDKKILRKIGNFSKDLASARSISNLIDICYKNIYQIKITNTPYGIPNFPTLMPAYEQIK